MAHPCRDKSESCFGILDICQCGPRSNLASAAYREVERGQIREDLGNTHDAITVLCPV